MGACFSSKRSGPKGYILIKKPEPAKYRCTSKLKIDFGRLLRRNNKSKGAGGWKTRLADLVGGQLKEATQFLRDLRLYLDAAVREQNHMRDELKKAAAKADDNTVPLEKRNNVGYALIQKSINCFMNDDLLADTEKKLTSFSEKLPRPADILEALTELQRKKCKEDIWEIIEWAALAITLAAMVACPLFLPAAAVAVGSAVVTAVTQVRSQLAKFHDESRSNVKEVCKALHDVLYELEKINCVGTNSYPNNVVEEGKNLRHLANDLHSQLDCLLKNSPGELTIDEEGLNKAIGSFMDEQKSFLRTLDKFFHLVTEAETKMEAAARQVGGSPGTNSVCRWAHANYS